ncbi:hypothetical protein KY343_05660 [Candidatus Woesearchaeota archaeon]|nr:hypothetical protein [Candidatus Woesearchaeota archaeon]
MVKCIMCEEEAAYRDKKPIIKKGRPFYLYYCKGCANGGKAFGWLESEDLEEVKNG